VSGQPGCEGKIFPGGSLNRLGSEVLFTWGLMGGTCGSGRTTARNGSGTLVISRNLYLPLFVLRTNQIMGQLTALERLGGRFAATSLDLLASNTEWLAPSTLTHTESGC
jgi:hypothetical protein